MGRGVMAQLFIFERVAVTAPSYATLHGRVGVVRDERRGGICKG